MLKPSSTSQAEMECTAWVCSCCPLPNCTELTIHTGQWTLHTVNTWHCSSALYCTVLNFAQCTMHSAQCTCTVYTTGAWYTTHRMHSSQPLAHLLLKLSQLQPTASLASPYPPSSYSSSTPNSYLMISHLCLQIHLHSMDSYVDLWFQFSQMPLSIVYGYQKWKLKSLNTDMSFSISLHFYTADIRSPVPFTLIAKGTLSCFSLSLLISNTPWLLSQWKLLVKKAPFVWEANQFAARDRLGERGAKERYRV